MSDYEAKIQKPDYNGLYYPSDAAALEDAIELAIGKTASFGPDLSELSVKALIVPSAGYSYSAEVAAAAYQKIMNRNYQRVIVIGSSHFLQFQGMALSESEYFETPLGQVEVDQILNAKLAIDFNFVVNELAFMKEYSIELQLPFLQKCLKEKFLLTPLVLGNKVDVNLIAERLADVIDDNTLIVVSTNLSHFLNNEKARKVDQETINALLNLDTNELQANGQASALNGLIILNEIAKLKGWQPVYLNYANSSDVGDDQNSVVGYGSLVYFGAPKEVSDE